MTLKILPTAALASTIVAAGIAFAQAQSSSTVGAGGSAAGLGR